VLEVESLSKSFGALAALSLGSCTPRPHIVTPADRSAIDPSGTTSVTIDFDLSQSIHEANGEWVFRPVLGPIVVS